MAPNIRDRKAVMSSIDDLISEPTDILSSVVARDRARRGGDRVTANVPEFTSIVQDALPSQGKISNERSAPPEKGNSLTESYRPAPDVKTEPVNHVRLSPEIKERLTTAQELCNSQLVPVTLRLPEAVNRWIDEYVHGAWESRLKKQDLIKEALTLLFIHRARNGDPLLLKDILPK